MEAVDKEQLKPLGHLDEARHETIEYRTNNHARYGEGYQRSLGIGVAPFAVVEYQTQGGDTEQVEQVYGYRHTDNVGYQHEIAVGVGLVGSVFPFEHQPYHQGGTE